MKIPLQNLCPICEGKGHDKEQQQCEECLGTGLIKDTEENRHRKLRRKNEDS